MPTVPKISREIAASVAVTANPLYRQIQAKLVANLRTALWKPGAAIPSEMELAEHYGVSQGTVRKAIDALVQEHVLLRRQGKGTFVATHAEQQQQTRFLRLRPDTSATGHNPPAERSIVACEKIKPPAWIAQALDLRSTQESMCVQRILAFAGDPVIVEHIWLPTAPFKTLRREKLQADTRPMYAMFEADYGISMVKASEQIKAIAADTALAQALQCQLASPLLMVQRISSTYENRPMELRQGWYKTLHQHYFNEIG